jgi:hypothetical protein
LLQVGEEPGVKPLVPRERRRSLSGRIGDDWGGGGSNGWLEGGLALPRCIPLGEPIPRQALGLHPIRYARSPGRAATVW